MKSTWWILSRMLCSNLDFQKQEHITPVQPIHGNYINLHHILKTNLISLKWNLYKISILVKASVGYSRLLYQMCEMKCLNCFSSDHPCIDQFTNLVFCIFIFMTIASLYFLYLNAVGLFILCEGFIVSINCLCRRSCPVHSSLSDLSL